jgi:hypothetical protein
MEDKKILLIAVSYSSYLWAFTFFIVKGIWADACYLILSANDLNLHNKYQSTCLLIFRL